MPRLPSDRSKNARRRPTRGTEVRRNQHVCENGSLTDRQTDGQRSNIYLGLLIVYLISRAFLTLINAVPSRQEEARKGSLSRIPIKLALVSPSFNTSCCRGVYVVGSSFPPRMFKITPTNSKLDIIQLPFRKIYSPPDEAFSSPRFHPFNQPNHPLL